MSSALAHATPIGLEDLEPLSLSARGGAQALLAPKRARPSYWTQGAAVSVYVLLLGAAALYSARPAPPVEEQPLELVMLPPAIPEPEELPAPVEEPPPPVAEETPPEEAQELPPPVAEEPPVAPVQPKPKPKPKPTPKVVEKKPPVEQPRKAAQSAAPARTGPTKVPPNAIVSGYANQVHARIARAAASSVPRAALARHESGRVAYRLVIAPSGAVISQSVSSSGNAEFDAAARQALARAAPFPATGLAAPAALSGAIVFR